MKSPPLPFRDRPLAPRKYFHKLQAKRRAKCALRRRTLIDHLLRNLPSLDL